MINVGDTVVCINAPAWRDMRSKQPKAGPTKGQILKVVGIRAGNYNKNMFGLMFEEFGNLGYLSEYFRKLVKDTEKGQDTVFLRLINNAVRNARQLTKV